MHSDPYDRLDAPRLIAINVAIAPPRTKRCGEPHRRILKPTDPRLNMGLGFLDYRRVLQDHMTHGIWTYALDQLAGYACSNKGQFAL